VWGGGVHEHEQLLYSSCLSMLSSRLWLISTFLVVKVMRRQIIVKQSTKAEQMSSSLQTGDGQSW